MGNIHLILCFSLSNQRVRWIRNLGRFFSKKTLVGSIWERWTTCSYVVRVIRLSLFYGKFFRYSQFNSQRRFTRSFLIMWLTHCPYYFCWLNSVSPTSDWQRKTKIKKWKWPEKRQKYRHPKFKRKTCQLLWNGEGMKWKSRWHVDQQQPTGRFVLARDIP
jgi:hypothetical protein